MQRELREIKRAMRMVSAIPWMDRDEWDTFCKREASSLLVSQQEERPFEKDHFGSSEQMAWESSFRKCFGSSDLLRMSIGLCEQQGLIVRVDYRNVVVQRMDIIPDENGPSYKWLDEGHDPLKGDGSRYFGIREYARESGYDFVMPITRQSLYPGREVLVEEGDIGHWSVIYMLQRTRDLTGEKWMALMGIWLNAFSLTDSRTDPLFVVQKGFPSYLASSERRFYESSAALILIAISQGGFLNEDVVEAVERERNLDAASMIASMCHVTDFSDPQEEILMSAGGARARLNGIRETLLESLKEILDKPGFFGFGEFIVLSSWMNRIASLGNMVESETLKKGAPRQCLVPGIHISSRLLQTISDAIPDSDLNYIQVPVPIWELRRVGDSEMRPRLVFISFLDLRKLPDDLTPLPRRHPDVARAIDSVTFSHCIPKIGKISHEVGKLKSSRSVARLSGSHEHDSNFCIGLGLFFFLIGMGGSLPQTGSYDHHARLSAPLSYHYTLRNDLGSMVCTMKSSNISCFYANKMTLHSSPGKPLVNHTCRMSGSPLFMSGGVILAVFSVISFIISMIIGCRTVAREKKRIDLSDKVFEESLGDDDLELEEMALFDSTVKNTYEEYGSAMDMIETNTRLTDEDKEPLKNNLRSLTKRFMGDTAQTKSLTKVSSLRLALRAAVRYFLLSAIALVNVAVYSYVIACFSPKVVACVETPCVCSGNLSICNLGLSGSITTTQELGNRQLNYHVVFEGQGDEAVLLVIDYVNCSKCIRCEGTGGCGVRAQANPGEALLHHHDRQWGNIGSVKCAFHLNIEYLYSVQAKSLAKGALFRTISNRVDFNPQLEADYTLDSHLPFDAAPYGIFLSETGEWMALTDKGDISSNRAYLFTEERDKEVYDYFMQHSLNSIIPDKVRDLIMARLNVPIPDETFAPSKPNEVMVKKYAIDGLAETTNIQEGSLSLSIASSACFNASGTHGSGSYWFDNGVFAIKPESDFYDGRSIYRRAGRTYTIEPGAGLKGYYDRGNCSFGFDPAAQGSGSLDSRCHSFIINPDGPEVDDRGDHDQGDSGTGSPILDWISSKVGIAVTSSFAIVLLIAIVAIAVGCCCCK